jgi:hypothetical protein
VDEIQFDVEMIIPETGKDDLGQEVHATATFLRCELVIGWRAHQGGGSEPLEIRKESLTAKLCALGVLGSLMRGAFGMRSTVAQR